MTDLEPLLSRLYEAALDPALWPAAWAEATEAAGVGTPLMLVAEGVPPPLPRPGWGRLAQAGTATIATLTPRAPGRAEMKAGTDRASLVQFNQHVRRAVRLRARLAMARTVQAANAAALQAADTGVVVVTAGGRLLHADPAAIRLAALVGLQLFAHRGGVHAADPAANGYLQGLLHDAAAGGSGGDMLMRGSDGSAVALTARALPLPAEAEMGAKSGEEGGEDAGCQAMLTLRRLAQVPVCPRRVSALFGLTRAESDVAVAVASGQDVAAVAKARGVAPGTVQAQVRTALDKAGVPSVTELGRLFARLG